MMRLVCCRRFLGSSHSCDLLGANYCVNYLVNEKAFQWDTYRPLADRILWNPRSHVRRKGVPPSNIPPIPWTYPPPEGTWYQRYPSPWKGHGTQALCGQTDTYENITILQLHLGAIKMDCTVRSGHIHIFSLVKFSMD